jgi:hypothetical protein
MLSIMDASTSKIPSALIVASALSLHHYPLFSVVTYFEDNPFWRRVANMPAPYKE